MSKEPFDERARSRANIQDDKRAPSKEQDRRATMVVSRIQTVVKDLAVHDVPPETLELSLFYNWVRLTTYIQGFGEEEFNEPSRDLASIMKSVIAVLKRAAAEIQDSGASESMREWGQKLEQMKVLYHRSGAKRRTREEIERHADNAVRTIFELTCECLDEGIHPSFIQRSLLYYWLRTSVINANVSEEFFQKMERNWDEVVARVDDFINDFWGKN